MRIVLENLLALQAVEQSPGGASPERDRQIVALRATIPERLLAHYDALMAHGRKSVALIQDGLCSECRQPVSPSALNGSTLGHPIQICIHCRCFLYRDGGETTSKPDAAHGKASSPRTKRSAAHV